jgi:hypothetical protein
MAMPGEFFFSASAAGLRPVLEPPFALSVKAPVGDLSLERISIDDAGNVSEAVSFATGFCVIKKGRNSESIRTMEPPRSE